MIKLIACDIDGTLLQNHARKLNPEVFPLIREFIHSGGIFVVASGRQYANLQRLFEPIKDEISYICENGSLVIHQDEILFRSAISKETGHEILRSILEKDGCELLLSGVNTCYLQPKEEAYLLHMRDDVKNNVTVVEDIFSVDEPYLKISACDRTQFDATQDYFSRKFGHIVTVVTSGNAWIDMMPPGVHKGMAIQLLSEKFHIPLSEIMAIGDSCNDMEMLQCVGYPVAMANAHPNVKALCSYETTLVEDTLYKVIHSFFN